MFELKMMSFEGISNVFSQIGSKEKAILNLQDQLIQLKSDLRSWKNQVKFVYDDLEFISKNLSRVFTFEDGVFDQKTVYANTLESLFKFINEIPYKTIYLSRLNDYLGKSTEELLSDTLDSIKTKILSKRYAEGFKLEVNILDYELGTFIFKSSKTISFSRGNTVQNLEKLPHLMREVDFFMAIQVIKNQFLYFL